MANSIFVRPGFGFFDGGGNLTLPGNITATGMAQFTGNVGIGISPSFTLDIMRSNTPATVALTCYSDSSPGGNVPFLLMRAARGTSVAPANLQTDDPILSINARGFIGGAVNAFSAAGNAVIIARAAENFSGANNVGTYWDIETTQIGTSTRNSKFRVDGNVTAAQTALMISIAGAAVQRVSVGANDSGGAGFRLLRVAN